MNRNVHAHLLRPRLFGGAFHRPVRRPPCTDRRHGARRRTRRFAQRALRRSLEGVRFRRRFSDARREKCYRRRGPGAGLDSADRARRSGAGRLWRSAGARHAPAVDRLPVDRRRLWRPWRRVGRRRNAAAAGYGPQPRSFGRRAGLAKIWRGPRRRGRHPPARRHLRAGTERVDPDRARRRQAHRQTGPGLQPHPCQRHCASHRCRVHAKSVRHFQRRR